jgi:hypothetical protein
LTHQILASLPRTWQILVLLSQFVQCRFEFSVSRSSVPFSHFLSFTLFALGSSMLSSSMFLMVVRLFHTNGRYASNKRPMEYFKLEAYQRNLLVSTCTICRTYSKYVHALFGTYLLLTYYLLETTYWYRRHHRTLPVRTYYQL